MNKISQFDINAPELQKISVEDFVFHYKKYIYGILVNKRVDRNLWDDVLNRVLERFFCCKGRRHADNCASRRKIRTGRGALAFDPAKGRFLAFLSQQVVWALGDVYRDSKKFGWNRAVFCGDCGVNGEDSMLSALDNAGHHYFSDLEYENTYEIFYTDECRDLQRGIMEEMANKMRGVNLQAFISYGLYGEAPDEVARRLGISVNQVYQAKKRGCDLYIATGQRLLRQM